MILIPTMTPQLQYGIDPEYCEGEVTDVAVTTATPFELRVPSVGAFVGADSTRASNNHVGPALSLPWNRDSQGKFPPFEAALPTSASSRAPAFEGTVDKNPMRGGS